jgi:lysophospholipase L1-like esterase
MTNASIVLFGDSYTAGRIPHTQTDGAFRAALGVPAYCDLAKSGSTAQQWAADFDDRLSSVVSSSADIAVGSLGGNDAFAALSDGVVTWGEQTSSMISLTLVLSRIAEKKPVLLMLYPNPYMGVPDKLPDAADKVRGLNELISSIADVINLSGHNPVMLLDLGTVLRPEHFDGVDIHPTEAGYRAMAEAVMDIIARM